MRKMSKIDKTDIENIKLITKEAKFDSLSKIKIKKGDYEIEISSEISNIVNPMTEIPPKNKNIVEENITTEQIKEENVV